MTQISLPKTSQTGTNEWADVEDNDVAIRDVVNGDLDTDNLSPTAGITGGQVAASAAIAGSKLDTGDGRLVQTTGIATASTNQSLTGSYADITGATVTFTPDVACYAIVQASIVSGNVSAGETLGGKLMVDGVAQAALLLTGGDLTGDVSASQFYRVALSAAAHTLKLQAYETGATCEIVATSTLFTYQLVAQ